MRLILATSLLAAFAVSPLAAQSATGCDRACLARVMTEYLDSLVAHDAKAAPLAASVRFTEDAKELPVGEGLWKTATKLRPFRTTRFQPRFPMRSTLASSRGSSPSACPAATASWWSSRPSMTT